MMRKLILFIVWGVVVAFGVNWLSQQTGKASIEWLGWQIDVSTSLLVSLLVGGIICLFMLQRLVKGFISWPSWMSANWRARRKMGGERALGLGMVAFAAGDFKAARKQARNAEKLLGAGMLPDLLSAQAAHASGDSRAALRYFTALSKQEDTAYFGQIGLMRLTHEKGQSAESIKNARAALALNPDSAPAAALLLAHDLTRQNWVGAYDKVGLLAGHNQDGLGPADTSLLAAHICLMIADQKEKAAERHDWLTRAAGFSERLTAPALRRADDEHRAGKTRQAIKTIETAFRALPHSDYLEALSNLTDDNEGQFVSRIGKLAVASKNTDKGYLMMAQAALDKRIWASASAALEKISPTARTNQFFLMTARLAEMRHVEDESFAAERDNALRQAAIAPRGPVWLCESCGASDEQWQATCGSCDTFGQVGWGVSNDRQNLISAQ
ncbi:MAG: heme biosynthesis HemY N-terminal domain-containing protein [Candidatus Puniceispirillaceae bacterium]